MDKKELEFLLRQGEGYNLEFKESFSSDISKEICAFANAVGGKILIGVTDNKKIKGIKITNRLKSQIQNLARNIDPKIEIIIEGIENILVIIIPEGKNKPYSVNGKFYVRQGTNSQQLTRDEIREFFQKEGKITFDEKVNLDFDLIRDIDEKAYENFLSQTKISPVIPKKDILQNLELIKDNKIKNAGVLLFSRKVTKFFSNATIICSLFQGNNKYKILNSQEFEADFYSNYQNAFEYLKSKLNTEYIIRTAGPREEKLELPEDALKEALLNAMAHRSYFEGGFIQIHIFSDRVEITNPGGLVPGLTIKDLGSKSRPRNHLLFGLMQRMDLVEKAGSGIARIKLAMEEYKLDSPTIEADKNWFTIIFKRPDLQEESYEQRIYGTAKKISPIGSEKSSEKSSEKILDLIKENREITIEELAKKLNLTTRAIDKNISKLKEKKLLKRVGPDKGGYWEVAGK